jgi:hypothetical protein
MKLEYIPKRITVKLHEDEMISLMTLSHREHRDTRQQAGMLIRTELIRLGLLKEGNEETNNKEGSQV